MQGRDGCEKERLRFDARYFRELLEKGADGHTDGQLTEKGAKTRQKRTLGAK